MEITIESKNNGIVHAEIDGINYYSINSETIEKSAPMGIKNNIWLNSSNSHKYAINAVDIDWNNAYLNSYINSTSDLLNIIKDCNTTLTNVTPDISFDYTLQSVTGKSTGVSEISGLAAYNNEIYAVSDDNGNGYSGVYKLNLPNYVGTLVNSIDKDCEGITFNDDGYIWVCTEGSGNDNQIYNVNNGKSYSFTYGSNTKKNGLEGIACIPGTNYILAGNQASPVRIYLYNDSTTSVDAYWDLTSLEEPSEIADLEYISSKQEVWVLDSKLAKIFIYRLDIVNKKLTYMRRTIQLPTVISVSDKEDENPEGMCVINNDLYISVELGNKIYKYDITEFNNLTSSTIYYTSTDNSIIIPNTEYFTNGRYISSNNESILYDRNISALPIEAFKNNTKLKTITLPSHITKIKPYTFEMCTNLESINLNYITKIYEGAFAGCNKLQSITLPSSQVYVYPETFMDCTSLTSLNLSGVRGIYQEAFARCDGLTDLYIPDSVTGIAYRAFSCCTMLSSLRLSNNLQFIGYQCFQGCFNLTTINIPDSVKIIYEEAFNGCYGVTHIKLPTNLKEIERHAFAFCNPDTIEYKGVTYTPDQVMQLNMALLDNNVTIGSDIFYSGEDDASINDDIMPMMDDL